MLLFLICFLSDYPPGTSSDTGTAAVTQPVQGGMNTQPDAVFVKGADGGEYLVNPLPTGGAGLGPVAI